MRKLVLGKPGLASWLAALACATVVLATPPSAAAADGYLIETMVDGLGGRTWNSYDLTIASGNLPMAGRPSAIVKNNLPRVYTVAPNGHLLETMVDGLGGRTWNTYDLTTSTPGPAMAGDSSAIYSNGVTRVFSRSTGGHLMLTTPDGLNGRTWNTYDLTTASGNNLPISGDPAVIAHGSLIRVYTVGANGHMLETKSDGLGGRTWNTYDLTASTGVTFVGDPAPALINNQPRIYARSTAGHLMETMVTGSGPIGGNSWATYNLTTASGNFPIRSHPTVIVHNGLPRVYTVGLNEHLLETMVDGVGGQTWNTYDLTPATQGPNLNYSCGPSAILLNQVPRVYACGRDGHIYESLVDGLNNRPWNTYDVTQIHPVPFVENVSAISLNGLPRVYSSRVRFTSSWTHGGANYRIDTVPEANAVIAAMNNAGSVAAATSIRDAMTPTDLQYVQAVSRNAIPIPQPEDLPTLGATQAPTNAELAALDTTPGEEGAASAAGAPPARCRTAQSRQIKLAVEDFFDMGWVSMRTRFCYNPRKHTAAYGGQLSADYDLARGYELLGWSLDWGDSFVQVQGYGPAPKGQVVMEKNFDINFCSPVGPGACATEERLKIVTYGRWDGSARARVLAR
jgi:hypothetical protein